MQSLLVIIVLICSVFQLFVCTFGDEHVFPSGCYVNCKCDPPNVFCDGKLWRELPVLPPSVQKFQLTAGSIERITQHTFKGKHMESLRTLILQGVGIRYISDNAFHSLIHLHKLYLSGNELRNIKASTIFSPQNQISLLDISACKIRRLDTSFMCGLPHLVEIYLDDNPINQLQFKHRCIGQLKKLEKLSFDHLLVHELLSNNFLGFTNSTLKYFSAGYCRIQKIERHIFLLFPKLKVLKLEFNSLITLTGVRFPNSLSYLYLWGNKLVSTSLNFLPRSLTKVSVTVSELTVKHMQAFAKMSKISHITFWDCGLSNISRDFFSSLENVSRPLFLSIENSSVQHIHPNAFEKLTNLQHISLKDNELSGETMANVQFNNSGILDSIYLDNNPLISLRDGFMQQLSFIPYLSTLGFKNTSLRILPLYSITSLRFLKDLYVSQNFFRNINFETSHGLEIEKIYLSNCKFLETIPKHLLCMCPNLKKIDISGSGIKQLTSNSFSCTKELTHINLSNNNINDLNSFDLPKLRILHISNNNIHNIFEGAFRSVPQLEDLRLSGHFVTRIYKWTLNHLFALKKLDLSHGILNYIHAEAFEDLKTLQSLDLTGNSLVQLDVRVFKPLTSLKELHIAYNGLLCSCDMLEFSHWLSSKQIYVAGMYQKQQNKCKPPHKTYRIELISYQVGELECNPALMHMVYISAVFVMYSLLTLVLSLTYRWRWYIRYKYFLCRTRVFRHREAAMSDRYMFDAFVSFSKHDCEWVMRELVPEIENNCGLKLCLYNRNWIGGRNIVDYIVRSIDHSRRVLFIVSNHSATSLWCSDELSLARYRMLQSRRDDLILVVLERIKQHNLTPLLQHLMRDRVYIQWPRDDDTMRRQFWKTLERALKNNMN